MWIEIHFWVAFSFSRNIQVNTVVIHHWFWYNFYESVFRYVFEIIIILFQLFTFVRDRSYIKSEYIFGLFLTHPLCQHTVHTVVNVSKSGHSSTPPTQSFCWCNIRMVLMQFQDSFVNKQLQKNQDASKERILIRVGIMRQEIGFKRRQFTVSIIIPSSLDASLQSWSNSSGHRT